MQHLRMFSQFASPRPREVTHMVAWRGYYDRSWGYTGMMRKAKEQAKPMVDRLERLPAGSRCIDLQWLLVYEMNITQWGGTDPEKVFERGSVDIGRALDALTPLSDELKRRRVPVDLLFVDHEAGFGYWELGQEKIGKILRNPKARRKLPARLRQLKESDFDWVRVRDTYEIWNRWTQKLRFDAFRKLLMDSGLFDIPTAGGGTSRPAACNFFTVLPTFRIYDYNGWPLIPASIDGVSSCGSAYIGDYGQRYDRREHHKIWNQVIDMVNHTRSCLGRPGARYFPMLGWPSWGQTGYWIWEQMVGHMVRTGVCWTTNKSALLYFNEHNVEIDDPVVSEILQRHDKPWEPQRDLPEIPLDSDEIRTGNYVTTYDEFLRNYTPPTLS